MPAMDHTAYDHRLHQMINMIMTPGSTRQADAGGLLTLGEHFPREQQTWLIMSLGLNNRIITTHNKGMFLSVVRGRKVEGCGEGTWQGEIGESISWKKERVGWESRW